MHFREFLQLFNFSEKKSYFHTLNHCYFLNVRKILFSKKQIFEQNSRMMGIKNKVLEWCTWYFFNPIQDVLFRVCSRIGGGEEGGGRPLLPKICHASLIMMKLGTVIS